MRPKAGPLDHGLVLAPLLGIVLLASLLLYAGRFDATADVRPPTPWRPLPEADTTIERIGFGSCLHQDYPQPIWTSVIAQRPQLFVMMGDNVYGDALDGTLSKMARSYMLQGRHPDLAPARATLPFYATWDDHDFGRNDGDSTYERIEEARRMFHAFWGSPSRRTGRPGVYDAMTFGPPERRVQIILLDTRSFRSPLARGRQPDGRPGKYLPSEDPAKTLLGAEQWRWLEAELRKPATVRFVVSSIQVLAANHGFETWAHLPRERRRLFELIRATGAKGIVFVSGDRHFGAIYRQAGVAPSPLSELTTSSLNRPFRPHFVMEPAGEARIGDGYGPENFGMAVIDWAGRSVTLELRGMEGATVRSLRLPFAELGL